MHLCKRGCWNVQVELDAIACLHFSSVLSSPKEVKISLGAFISSHYRFTLCVCVSVCVRQTAGIRSECLVWHVNKLCGADGHQRDPSRQIKGERGSSCFRSLVHSVNSVSASTSHQHKHTHTQTPWPSESVWQRGGRQGRVNGIIIWEEAETTTGPCVWGWWPFLCVTLCSYWSDCGGRKRVGSRVTAWEKN